MMILYHQGDYIVEAIYYRWSGDHKTIVDIGNHDVTAIMYLRIAIDNQKEYFKKQVREDPLRTYWLYKLKREIRSMEQLADVLSNVMDDTYITDQEKAAQQAYSMIMPWRDK